MLALDQVGEAKHCVERVSFPEAWTCSQDTRFPDGRGAHYVYLESSLDIHICFLVFRGIPHAGSVARVLAVPVAGGGQ